MIPVPDNVAFYWSDPTNKAAVNVLAGKTEVPPDLSLDEVERFELANLASQRVRVDFWRMLRSLWSVTWETAVRAELPSARLLRYGEHGNLLNDDFTPSVERAWSERLTYGLHEVAKQGHIATCVWLPERAADRDLQLSFYFLDPGGGWATSDSLEIGPEWSNEDGWRVTHDQALAFMNDGSAIDPAPLIALSRSAVSALAAALARTSAKP